MYEIIVFNGKGRILRVLETESMPLAKLYAMQNTTAKGHTDIIDDETGEVLFTVEGQGRDMFPKVTYDITKTVRTTY